ncbi:MAG TPA: hypothetical protein VNQ90_18905, partial [Chthoniobacteraceae bacterium]|nr:hypothetical protein [Chthoniobacteraceae bacterium]
FLVVEEERVPTVEAALKESYFVTPFQLRDGMSGGKLYLNYRWFHEAFPGRAPERVGPLQTLDEEEPVQ